MNLHEQDEWDALDMADKLLEAVQDFTRGDCQLGHIRRLIRKRLNELAPPTHDPYHDADPGTLGP